MASKKSYKTKIGYLQHLEFQNIENSNVINKNSIIKRNFILFIMLFLVNRADKSGYGIQILPEYYPEFLTNIELPLVICLLCYQYIFKYFIYSGKIKAYYRRNYSQYLKLMTYIKNISYGIIFRQIVVQSSFLVYTLLGDYSAAEALDKMAMDVFTPYSLIPVFLFGLYIYNMYYSDRYMSLKKYHINMINLFKKFNMDSKQTHCKLIQEVDKTYGITYINGQVVSVKSPVTTKTIRVNNKVIIPSKSGGKDLLKDIGDELSDFWETLS